jgi:hypothetical protein
MARSFCSQLDQAERRALVKNYDQKTSADNADKNAFALAFMNDRREDVFADKLRHRSRSGDVSRRKARKARRIHIADVAVKSDRLTVAVDEENDAPGALDAKAREDVLYPLKLMFVYNNGRFCHENFSL